MASLNDRDAGQDFEGNGPSSFDPRDYRFDASGPDLSDSRWAEKQAVVAEAIAHCERAFGPGNPHHAKWEAIYAERSPALKQKAA